MHKVMSYMIDKTQDMLEMLKTVVEHESPSTYKPATDKLAAHLTDQFAMLGASAALIPQAQYGNHVRVEYGTGEEQVLVLCHMDTVWAVGEIKKRPFRVDGENAYGPGAYDMKAGIVQTYFALKALNDLGLTPRKRVVVILNTDEEVGSPTSRPIIEAEARKSTHALVLEPSVPPLGAIKTFRKGVGMFRITITGKAAHAGADPEKGISAIGEMAHQVLKLHAMNDFKTGTTVNVGVVSGGTRSNVVAAEARAEVDIRVTTQAEGERLVKEILNLRPQIEGAKISVAGGMNRPPMERTPKIVETYHFAKKLAAELGFELHESGTGGGSDGNFTAAIGTPTLDGLGALGGGGHADNEYVIIKHMPERAALLARLLETL
jgi:glutamate carboxypeptidase